MNKREKIIKIAEQCSEHIKMGEVDTRMFIYESNFPKLADAIMDMDEWVSVEDEVPKPDESVICTDGNYCWEDTWEMQYESPVSFSSKTIPVGFGFSEGHSATHWIRIPELPKPKK